MSSPSPAPKIIYWLMLAGFILRLVFALVAQNIDHPDEVFQYLEPAHRLVFGYGMETWEYRFGTRSWLIPFFVSVPLYLTQMLHADDPSIYIPLVKSMFCLLSMSLIFTSYIVGRNLISERAGISAAVLCTFWYELIYFAFRPLSDVVSTYFLVAALAFLLDRGRQGRPFLFAICAAISALTRIQYVPVLCLLMLVAAFTWRKPNVFKALAASVVVCLLLGGLVDYLTWGSFFASTYNSFLFNGVYNVGNLFTEDKPLFWYVEALLSASTGILVSSFLGSCVLYKRLWLPASCVAIIVVTHSFVPSKEYRYIFAAIPILLIMAAALIDIAVQSKISAANTKSVYQKLCICLVIVSLAGCQGWLPNEKAAYRLSPLYKRQVGLEALSMLSHEKDVAGLLIDKKMWWKSGGYYYLHKAIPMYRPEIDFKDCAEANSYISHMLCPADQLCPDFTPIAQFDGYALGKNVKLQYRSFPNRNYQLLQPGIDDSYKSTVHSFLAN